MSTRTIELDASQPWEPPPPPRGHRTLPRWLIPGLVLLLAPMAPLAASGTADPYAPIFTTGTSGRRLMIAGDTLFAVPSDPFQTEQRIRAYTLPGGEPRWGRALAGGDWSWRAAGTVLYAMRSRQAGGDQRPERLEALDAHTGQTLWARDNVDLMLPGDEYAVLRDWPAEVASYEQFEHLTVGLRVVDPRTGRELWARTPVRPWAFASEATGWPGSMGLLRGAPARLVELSTDGQLLLTDLATGVAVRSVRLALAGTADYVEVIGDEVNVRMGAERATFDLRTGRLKSSASVATGVINCGQRYLCKTIFGDNGSSHLDLYDKRTGRLVQSMPRTRMLGLFGERLLIQPELPQRGAMVTMLIDLARDPVPRSLAPWGSIDILDDRHLLAASHVLGKNGSVIAVLDPGTGYAEVIGLAPGWYVPPDCSIWAEYVVCTGTNAAVWRLPKRLRSWHPS